MEIKSRKLTKMETTHSPNLRENKREKSCGYEKRNDKSRRKKTALPESSSRAPSLSVFTFLFIDIVLPIVTLNVLHPFRVKV